MQQQATQKTTVKMMSAEEGRVGGYLIVWGNPQLRDLQGEYFTPQTDLALDWFVQRPVLYQHGLDARMKASPVGVIDRLRQDSVGLWAEAQLDLRQTYVQVVLDLIKRGVLSWSSGSLSHLVQVATDGQILRWPLVEGSLTPTPAEPRRTDVQTLKSAYLALGLDLNRLKECTGMQNEHESTKTMESNAVKRLPTAVSDGAKPASVSVGSAFDRYDALDLLHGYMMLRAGKQFQGVSEQYANALAHKVRKVGGTGALKANELSHTTQIGFGDEWVPELWSAQIWEKARLDNVVLPLFRAIEMPSSPFELPIEGTDPTVYYVPETAHESQLTLGTGTPIPSSKIGSGKVQLNARKLALRVGFSAELVEDAILPVLNVYREQAVRAIADSIDHALLNGDTEDGVDANINTPLAPVGNERFLVFDGLRKLPIVTNTANRVSMGGDPTLAKMREARFTLAARYAARPGSLAWIVDSGTYAKLLGLSEFLTMDKAGSLATAMTGQIGLIDGIPVFASPELPLTSATGDIKASGNTKGTAICVYRPGWFVGYRRRIAVNVDYIPYYDSYQLTATVRLAFANFDNDVASALVNITV